MRRRRKRGEIDLRTRVDSPSGLRFPITMPDSKNAEEQGLRRADWLAYGAVLLVFIGFLAYCRAQAGKKTPTNPKIEDHVRHANTYYWFGMFGRGSMAALSSGQKHIGLARQMFDEGPGAERAKLKAELPSANAASRPQVESRIAAIDELDHTISGMEKDIRYQQVLHYDTFHGVFPWSHFMAKPTLFRDPRSSGSFEMNDQPAVIAARTAINSLIDKTLEAQTVIAQYDVVFVTDPQDFPNENPTNPAPRRLSSQLENEALYLFSRNPRFFVHNMREVGQALTDEEVLKLRQLAPTATMLEKLRRDWRERDLLVVRVKKIDEVNRHHMYAAEGRFFTGTDPAPEAVYNTYGFCRDRRFTLPPVMFFNCLMLFAAIMVFRILAQASSYDHCPPPWKTAIGLGIIGWIWGRVIVWGLVEIVEKVVPADENLAILSFWWPMITGFIILLGPGFILRFTEERFRWLDQAFGLYHRRGALWAAVSMGSVTYVGQAALWVRGWNGWLLLPPLILATISCAWILGRALDDADPITKPWGMAVAAWALFIGLAFSDSFPTSQHHLKLWAVAVPMLLIAYAAIKRSGHVVRVTSSAPSEAADKPADTTLGLTHLIQNPPFQTTPAFADAGRELEAWRNGRAIQLQIVGPAGVGKTALISAIARDALASGDATASGEVAILRGSCPEPQDGVAPEPYRVIADILADHFAVNLLRPPKSPVAGIDKAVDGIFEEVVPFSDILFPKVKDEGAAGSKSELFHSVAATLRCLAQQRKVLMIVDDAHWLDNGSRELLRQLATEHLSGESVPIALITASRKDDDLLNGKTIHLSALREAEVEQLLIEGLGLAPKAANELAQAVGEEQGNLHWLFHMLAYLNGRGVMRHGSEGWTWDAATKLSDHLPDDLRDAVMNVLNRDPKYRDILECAACIGPKFTVEVLSGAANMPRFECIRLLDRLEAETGYVRDLPEEDDVFAFRSSFLLEVIRNLLGIHAGGPNQPIAQRVREYHSELAKVWESATEQSSAATYRLANHRYAAGRRHAQQAAAELVSAAWASSRQFQHGQARQYLEMARECAAAAGMDAHELACETLLIECHTAHVEGIHRVETAAKIREYLEAHPDSDADVYVAAALAAYDAGLDTRKPEHFAAAVTLGRQLVKRFKDPLEQATGHHFIGLGLPSGEKAERLKHLQKAMNLVEALEGNEAQRLKARIANSLGEELSHGDDADRKSAREYFEQSIELKSFPATRDVEGLALAHGGLGRLAFFADEPDYDTAREHFAEDLRYSEKIGSVTGQTKMHSLLGACDLNSDPAKPEDARTHYEAAISFAEEDFDRYFALAGLIEAHSALNQTAEADHRGQELVDLTKSRHASCPEQDRPANPGAIIPRLCLDALRRALDRSPGSKSAEWHLWLGDQIRS